MKTLFAAMVVLSGLTLAGHAQVVAKETPELKALQSKYKTDSRAALKPVQERFIAQYESLLRGFTTRGDLAAAMAVQEEINALKKAMTETVGTSTATKEDLEKKVVGHWTYGNDKVWLGLRPNGKAFVEKFVYQWKAESENTISMYDPKNPSAKAFLEFDSTVNSFTGKDVDGKRVTGVRRDRE